MTTMQQGLLRSIVDGCNSDTLNTVANRRALASRISDALNVWEDMVLSFLNDMRGLDLSLPEDRESFIQFAILGLA